MKNKEIKEQLIKEIEDYLNDFDNIKDCNFFPESRNIEEFTYDRKEKTLKHFVSTGREYIRRYLMILKNISILTNNQTNKCKECRSFEDGEACIFCEDMDFFTSKIINN